VAASAAAGAPLLMRARRLLLPPPSLHPARISAAKANTIKTVFVI
jgi:hypothetical protein